MHFLKIHSPNFIVILSYYLVGILLYLTKTVVLNFVILYIIIGWLEGLVSRVAEDRKRVVCPVIDIISDETFAYVKSFELHWGAFNWDLHFRWYTRTTADTMKRQRDITQAFRTPAMAGGLFAMDKSYFFELGGYDEKMEIWGGENLELSFRVQLESPLIIIGFQCKDIFLELLDNLFRVHASIHM